MENQWLIYDLAKERRADIVRDAKFARQGKSHEYHGESPKLMKRLRFFLNSHG